MEPEEFIKFVESINDARNTGGSLKSRKYFNAVCIGYHRPSFDPPKGDRIAEEGYELGLRLQHRCNEKV
jgi:hypothetical protein